jgi:hypothetical protein
MPTESTLADGTKVTSSEVTSEYFTIRETFPSGGTAVFGRFRSEGGAQAGLQQAAVDGMIDPENTYTIIKVTVTTSTVRLTKEVEL